MAADGAGPRGVQAAGAAAHHGDALLLRSGGQLALTAHAGVHRAGDGLTGEHVGHTAQQTADAGRERLQLAVPGLGGQLRVSDALAAEGDQVGPALLHQQLGVLGLGKPAHGDHGNGYRPLDLRHQIGVEAAVGDAGCPHELVMQVDGAGHMQGVHAALLLQIGRHRRRVLYALAALHLVAGVDAAQDGQVAAGLAADVLNDEPGQAHAVFKAAAELVGAVVGALGDEGADQIPVGTVHLHHVDTGLLGAARRVAVALDDAVDLLVGHRLRDLPARRGGHGAGGLQGIARQGGVPLGARVLQLDGHLGAVGVAGVRHTAEALHRVVREQTGLPGAALGLPVHHRGLDGDQAEAALGPGLIVGQGTVAEGAVGVGKVVAHGGHHKAVGNRHRADLHGRKHGREFHHRTSLPQNRVRRRTSPALPGRAYPCR